MSLPLPWIEKVFQKLTLTFGREFINRWEGVPLEEVKADWAHELRGFQQNPKAIAYGLEHCVSGKPPTVQDFKAICLRRQDTFVSLPAPAVPPEKVAAELAKIAKPVENHHGMKDWAYRLKARHEAGDKLSLYQIKCYTEALT